MRNPSRRRSYGPWKRVAILLGAPLFLVGWDVAAVLLVRSRHPALARDELVLYLAVKSGFLAPLCLLVMISGGWRRWGLAGEITWRQWLAMGPAWLMALMALPRAIPDVSVMRVAGWLAVGLAVAIGEETVFRGFVQGALASRGARSGVIGSAVAFGVTHAIGLFAGLDWHMVLAQMIFATGLGLCFGWVRAVTGSIWPGVAAHAAMDGLVLVAADGVSGTMNYDGGSFPGTAIMAAFALIWGVALVARPIPEAVDRGRTAGSVAST